MNERPFFSIVMPAYGVEQYIAKAIESVQNQTFSDWEVIVVDDCTPDRSGEIAKRYAEQDSRIRVVHHEVNQGLSPARNTGTDAARGQYIWYMDPDDWVENDLLQRVWDSLEKNPAQIVVFGLVEEYYDSAGELKYTNTICPKEQFYETKEQVHKVILDLEQKTLYGYAWNKFYDLDYIKKQNFRFQNVKLIEDIMFNVTFCMDIERMNILSAAPYHYGKRVSQNLTNKFVPDYYKLHRKRIEMLYQQQLYWGRDQESVRRILGSLYARYILSALERNCDKQARMTTRRRYGWIQRVFEDSLFIDLIPYARAKESKALTVALKLFQWKRPLLCLMMGRGVHIIRTYCYVLYSKVKSGR